MEIGEPRKSVFQITLSEKATDKILFSADVIDYSESAVIEKVKVGSIIKELGLKREDVDFYIKIVGHLYEGETFAEALSKKPELTAEEKAKCAEIK
ncbi:MAG: hypothetical protein PHI12_08600 [Dehalococcoidales bacterium]|nr:hypothetical protein [Dehalococcoidales bacterium]